jgi:hypothetical protein
VELKMSLSDEWDQLCEEHAAARDAHLKAFGAINQSFQNGSNPTIDETEDFEKTWQVWEDVKRRMSTLIKNDT